MFKPLLRTLPTLSGNVQIACKLTDYFSLNENNYECYVRHASLLPLNSNIYNKTIDISLLNSTYDYDLKDFYKWYSEYFFTSTFEYNKTDYSKLISTITQNNRDTDFELGVKRNLYSSSNTQYNFYAPIFIESAEDVPDYFLINIDLRNDAYYTTKTIRVNINYNSSYSHNYLFNYINRYANKLDSNVIYLSAYTNQAIYYGINLVNGGFYKATDNIIYKVYNKQTTIQGFDVTINNGFKRNKIAMRQILPLSFNFNVDSILSSNDKLKYTNASLKITGTYYKNGKPIDFYDFNVDYTSLIQNVLTLNEFNGIFEYVNSTNDIMDMNFPALNEGKYINYKYSNKISPFYNRWKLNYSDDSDPYITNINYAFSANQNSTFKYKYFPENFISINALTDSTNNLLIPIGSVADDPSSPYYYNKSLINNYKYILNNYSTNWFNIIDENDNINDIFKNESYWANVINNKVYYNGILYNFNNIHYAYPELYDIKKFAVFVNLHFKPIDLKYLKNIKKSTYTLYNSNKYCYSPNCLVNEQLNNSLHNNTFTTLSSLYQNESTNLTNKNQLVNNNIFLEDTNGTGDFINLTDYGFDIYEANRYFKLSDIQNTINENVGFNVQLGASSFTSITYILSSIDNIDKYFCNGFELLPVHKLNEIIYESESLSYINILDNNSLTSEEKWMHDNLYYSIGSNSSKSKYDKYELQLLYNNYGEDINKVTLYTYGYFISYSSFKNILTDYLGDIGKEYASYSAYLTSFEFQPEVSDNNNNIYATNCFMKHDTCIGNYYGDFIPRHRISDDRDVLYVDPYNINNLIVKYNNSIKSNVQPLPLYTDDRSYDYDLDKLFAFINDNINNDMQDLIKELGVDIEELNNIELNYPLGTCYAFESDVYNYLAKLSLYGIVVKIYLRDDWVEPDLRDKDTPKYKGEVDCKYTLNDKYGSVLAENFDMPTNDNYEYETLNDNNSYEFYARFLNKKHLYWYINTLYNNFTLTNNYVNALESLYVKKRVVINNTKGHNDLYIRDMYMPLTHFYDDKMQLTNTELCNLLNNISRNNEFSIYTKNNNIYSTTSYDELYFIINNGNLNIFDLTKIKYYKYVNDTYELLSADEIKTIIYAYYNYQTELNELTDSFRNIYISKYCKYINIKDYYETDTNIDAFEQILNNMLYKNIWYYLNGDKYEELTLDKKIAILNGYKGYATFYKNKDNEYIAKKYQNYKYYAKITKESNNYNKWCSNILQQLMQTIELENNSNIIWKFSDAYSINTDINNLADIDNIIEHSSNNMGISEFRFELCYKKRFIKLNNNLFKLINLDDVSSHPYKDLYIYRTYKKEEFPSKLRYYYSSNVDALDKSDEITHCLLPIFDDIYMQDKNEAAVYNEYIQNKITPCTYAIWKGMPNTIFIGSSKEEVENITGQTAIQYWCPAKVHYFWYSGAGTSINTPTKYANYYRYNGNNATMMYDISDFTEDNYPLIGKNKITNKEANYYTSTYITYCKTHGINLPNSYALNTYMLLDNCKSNLALYKSVTAYNYDEIVYTYVDYNNPTICTKDIYKDYSETVFNNIFDRNDDIEYSVNENNIYTVKTTYSYVDYPVYKYIEHKIGYSYWECNDCNLYSDFKLNTYNVTYTYTYTYQYNVEVSNLVTSQNNSFNSYYVTTIETKQGSKEATSYTTYGFYVIDAYIDNTLNSFNIIDTKYDVKKYFSYINNNYIYNDNYSVKDTFKLILPFSKLNLLNSLYKNVNTVVKPSKFTIPSIYKSTQLIKDNEYYGNDILYSDIPYGNITLHRYLDDISPLLTKTNNIYNAYCLKYKTNDISFNTSYSSSSIYPTDINIYYFEPYRVYKQSNSVEFDKFYPVEYKYFNDNKYYNLETEFTISVYKLNYVQLLEYEKQEITIKYFANHININNKNSLSDTEILFLFNKYNVKYSSVVTGLNVDKTEKLYTLEYKFTLL